MLLRISKFVAAFLVVGSAFGVDRAGAQTSDNVGTTSKLDRALSTSVRNGHSGWQRVIIQANPDHAPALAAKLRERGSIVKRSHAIINGLTATVPVSELESLSRLSSVKSISLDAIVTADQTTTPYTLRATLGLPANPTTGNRVGVAVIDSGIEPGPDFGDRINGFYDFTEGGRVESADERVRPRNARRRPDRRRRRPGAEAIPGGCAAFPARCTESARRERHR